MAPSIRAESRLVPSSTSATLGGQWSDADGHQTRGRSSAKPVKLGHAPPRSTRRVRRYVTPKGAREVAFSEIVEQLPTGIDARGVERPLQRSVTPPARRPMS